MTRRRLPSSPLARRVLHAAFTALLIAGCSPPSWQRPPHDRVFQHSAPVKLHPRPREIEPSEWWEAIYTGSFAQLAEAASPGRHAQDAFAHEIALDVNAFGQVPDSTWFENRIGRAPLTVAQIRRGPNTTDGPAPGPLVVKSAKNDGVTPGLVVKDSAGDRWIVKFDPPAYPELTSAAEVISTRLLYAAGYHVPENHVVRFDLARLTLSSDATIEDRYGREVPFDDLRLRRLLALLNPEPDGRIRAMFSKYLPGKPLGPFPLAGTRLDDPNDRIPHERRRSLRGLWVFYAWINNTDAKLANSLDVFVETKKSGAPLGYVRHFLLDFGTTLGAAPEGPKPMIEGYEYVVDWERVLGRLVTAGVVYPYWATAHRTPLRSVGQFESRVFDPAKWRPMQPNAAFERADRRDTLWAASVLAHVDPVTVAAAVSAGEYSEEAAAVWVLYTLIQRRDKLLRHAFDGFAPLDHPRVEHGSRVVLTDLEILAGLRSHGELAYRWHLVWHGPMKDVGVAAGVSPSASCSLKAVVPALAAQLDPTVFDDFPYFTLSMTRTRVGAPPERVPRAEVRLRLLSGQVWIPVGLEHVTR